MIEFLRSDYFFLIIIALATAFSLTATIITLLVTVNLKRQRSGYSEALDRVKHSPLREDIEQKIEKLQEALTASELSWREVNHLLTSALQKRVGSLGGDQYHVLDSEEDRVLASMALGKNSDFHWSPRPVRRSFFLSKFGIKHEDVIIDPKSVFLLTPFSESQLYVYKTVLHVCSQHNLVCERGDEKKVEGDLLRHILASICKARLIIANVSTRNSNVFYELGIAHALDKQVLLISQQTRKLDFDISTRQILFFKDRDDLEKRLSKSLKQIQQRWEYFDQKLDDARQRLDNERRKTVYDDVTKLERLRAEMESIWSQRQTIEEIISQSRQHSIANDESISDETVSNDDTSNNRKGWFYRFLYGDER